MTDVVVLGLDGATWDVLSPLMEDGRLPNIEQVVSSGQSGTLESTFPPITAPAWLSMATGQNPGKTGVFYFLNRDNPNSFEFEPLGSDKFQGQSFWDILTANNHSTGIFNYPMLYPPYEIDGFMVSGLGSDVDDTIAYPESLGKELDEVTDGYQVKVPYADPKYQGRPTALKRDLLNIIDKRERAIDYLLSEKEIDHFFGIISATDWAQHYFWRYYDENHALYDPEAGHRDALVQIWERVDETVGLVAKHVRQEGANLLIVSDHGFGPINRTFHSNEWLKQQGFMKAADQSVLDKIQTKYFPYIRQVGETVVSIIPPLNDFAKSLGESIRKSPGAGVDFKKSTAFSPNQGITCGIIYMLSESSQDKNEIIAELEALPEREDGPENIEIFEAEEIYHGPKTNLAPDLLFQLEGFECAVDPRPTVEREVFSTGPPFISRNGGHNQEGIMIATGPDIQSENEIVASIYDITPTLLYLHELPIPEEADGTVLTDLFDSETIESRNIERSPIANLTRTMGTTTRKDNSEVQERLEDLGYL